MDRASGSGVWMRDVDASIDFLEYTLPEELEVEDKDITPSKVKALADAAEACWAAILAHDLAAFASAYKASFEAQVAMFPGMVSPTYIEHPEEDGTYIANAIAHYSAMDDVLAWKMPGAGGGGYLALVVKDAKSFTESHPEAFEIKIRRE